MTAFSNRVNANKAKRANGTAKIKIPKTASSGIKHQVILPKSSTVIAPSSSTITGAIQSSAPTNVLASGNYAQSSSPTKTTKIVSRPGAVSKRNGVWYLGGNHVVKLLTSVDGDLDHSVLSKLAAVPTVVGELALSVESLVSDDITVGGFESDLLAKITSNTLTAKRGIVAAAAASTTMTDNAVTATPQTIAVGVTQSTNNAQPATQAVGVTNSAPSVEAGDGQVPNPLLANYQPVPNPLATRITPPASPHADATEEQATSSPETRTELPMIKAR